MDSESSLLLSWDLWTSCDHHLPYNQQPLSVLTIIHFYTFLHVHIFYPTSVGGQQTVTHHGHDPCPKC